jgi:hypothetical protein
MTTLLRDYGTTGRRTTGLKAKVGTGAWLQRYMVAALHGYMVTCPGVLIGARLQFRLSRRFAAARKARA